MTGSQILIGVPIFMHIYVRTLFPIHDSRFEGSYEIEPIQLGAPVENEHRGNAIFGLCEEVISAAHPGATCLPWVIQGFTDARAFAEVGIPTFGFSPLWCPPSLPFADLVRTSPTRPGLPTTPALYIRPPGNVQLTRHRIAHNCRTQRVPALKVLMFRNVPY